MKRIYIGNLSFSTTEESLSKLFSQFEVPQKTEIIKDKNTGSSKGFGFVELTDENAEQAIKALNGTMLDGRKLRISLSVR